MFFPRSRRQFLIGSLKSAAAFFLSFRRFAAARRKETAAFVISVWSGALTPTSVRVNARLAQDSTTVRLLASPNIDLSNPVASDYYVADLSTNYRVVSLLLTGLKPDTHYYYAIEADGVVDRVMQGSFRTPAAGPFSFTFAFASCARTASNHPVFATIRQHNPLFFVHMGDMHYLDIGINDRTLFREAYNTVLAQPNQAALYQNIPLAYMWDDHDYGPNDSDATSPSRQASRLTYQEYVPHYPLVAGSGDVPIYQAFTIGRVRFIMTDTRSERTPKSAPDNAGKSMMGSQQKAWFKQELLNANGDYPVIIWVSTNPWICDAPGDEHDDWAGYTTERQELADFIEENQIKGLFMISGDIHMLAIDDGRNNRYATSGERGFPVMQAAALDSGGTFYPDNQYSEGQYPGGGHFGLMRVTDDGGPTIFLEWSGRNFLDEEVVYLEMTVPPSPRLAVSPAQLLFVTSPEGPQQLEQNLNISNINVGQFEWTITVNEAAPWLNLSMDHGSVAAGQSITVQATADPGGLESGVYRSTLMLAATPATHSPQTLPVMLLVTEQPLYYLPRI